MSARDLEIWYETTDYSLDAESYTEDSFTITLTSSQFIYAGYHKPINELYPFLTTFNTNSVTLSVEYYNGSSFTAVANLTDRSKSFSKNGFIKWDRNNTDESKTTVNSLERYWYRLSVDSDTTEMVFRGLNLLFSEDSMIKEDEPHLLSTNYYPSGESTFINYHQSARNELIQRLRNKGYAVKDGSGNVSDLNIFDLHDRAQLSVAAKYLVLSKIYFILSDSPEDKYYQKFVDYKTMADDAFNVFYLSLDTDDDGKKDQIEQNHFRSGIIQSV